MAYHLKKSTRSIALIAFGAVAIVVLYRYEATAPVSQISTTSQQKLPTPVTLTFVGDIMMDRGVKSSVIKNFAGDYHALFVNTTYLQDADIAFANLEGSVATGGHNVGSRFSFHMDPTSLGALHDSGIDIVSFANNHVGDYAMEGFEESLQNLRDHTVSFTGAGESRADVVTPTIITVRGMNIGFLGATDVGPNWLAAKESNPGILLASDPELPSIILEAKKQVDILVMSFHWGVEYSPSNAHQEKLAHSVIDAGADIVVGTHPHVIERVEMYHNKPIFYSLGNYIFDQYFSPHTMHGMVALVSIDPTTKALTATEEVSPLSRQFVPQPLVPFDESMLVTKKFVP